MNRLDMAAVAIKSAAIGAALLLLSGCHPDRGTTTLSERYRVCANLPVGATFHSDAPGPDFDLGTLKIDGFAVDVFIGSHPRFSHSVIKRGVEATNGFRFLGNERSDEQDKALLAYARGDETGPIYVMFTARDLRTVKPMLAKKNLLVSCR